MLKNRNNLDQKFTDDTVQLIQSSLEQGKICPFEDVNFTLAPELRCPVCGSLGGMSDSVYCITDFQKESLIKND